jgi:ferritin-like metal-binding protein YciE
MKLDTLHDLYVKELQDLYDAERQIVKALPKMAKAASSSELQSAFEEHLEQTKGHVERLERIFDMLDVSAKGKKCKGLSGIVEEGEELISKRKDINPDVLDAGLIAAAQRVEHYEIAGYGTVRTYADMLGHKEAAELLQQTLDEEKETDQKLTQLAEGMINIEATG